MCVSGEELHFVRREITVLALVFLLPHMALLLMFLQTTSTPAFVITCGTRIRSLPAMNIRVLSKRIPPPELGITQLARKVELTTVYLLVLLQTGRFGTRELAFCARVRLFARMNAHVSRQTAFQFELCFAHGAVMIELRIV